MPIKKPGKGHSNPGKYRTIALIFNRCKLMQRMVNEWLVQFLVKKYNLIKIGSHVSEPRKIENGTPQGSVASPTLFSVMINGIFKDMSVDYGKLLFAHDGAL